jgi:hypothetical protein
MPPDWVNAIWESLFAPPPRRALFRRRMRLSRQVVTWLRDPVRTDAERWAFADLLLRLDSDPFTHSSAILTPGTPPGIRWALLERWHIVIKFDPVEDRVTIISINPATAG